MSQINGVDQSAAGQHRFPRLARRMQADGVIPVGKTESKQAGPSAATMGDEIGSEYQRVEQRCYAAALYRLESAHGVGSMATVRTENGGPMPAYEARRKVLSGERKQMVKGSQSPKKSAVPVEARAVHAGKCRSRLPSG